MKNNNTKITLALFGVLVAVIITVPIGYGYLTSAPGKKFLGITGLYPVEQFYYISMGPSQAVKGNLLFADKYCRIADENVLVNPIANIISLTSQITNTSLPVSFNIFRALSALLLIVAFYHLSKQFITSRLTLWISLFLYCFSAGFDSLFHLLNISAIDAVDDSIPEANMFIAMSGEFYLPLANALFILTLASAYNLFYRHSKKNMLLYGFALFLLGTVYVYGLVSSVIIILTAALYFGYSLNNMRANATTLFKLSLFCLPVASYYLWLISRFPNMTDEGWFSFPDFPSFISTFSFGLLFTVVGLFIKGRPILSKEVHLILWILVILFLIYLPLTILPIQIQVLIGLGAPLAILSATSLEAAYKYLSHKFPFFSRLGKSVLGIVLVFCLIILSSLTNLKFYAQQFTTMNKQEPPCYLDSKVHDAMEWSSKNMTGKNLVIISRKLGFIFSSITATKVYMGIAPFNQKTPEQKSIEFALDLVKNGKTGEGERILLKTNADYLFLDSTLAGIHFKNLREPLKALYSECFRNTEVSIFKLK